MANHACNFNKPANHPGAVVDRGFGAFAVAGQGPVAGVSECECGRWRDNATGEVMLGNSREAASIIADATKRA